jgi:hypothetical protein
VGGDKPIGLAIGIIVVAALVALPVAIVPVFYLFANVYAIVTGSDFGSDTMNLGAFFALLVMTVALFLLVTAGAISLVGRALSPKNRED